MNLCSKCGALADFHADNAPSEGYRCGDCTITSRDIEYISALGEPVGEILGEETGWHIDGESFLEGDEEE